MLFEQMTLAHVEIDSSRFFEGLKCLRRGSKR